MQQHDPRQRVPSGRLVTAGHDPDGRALFLTDGDALSMQFAEGVHALFYGGRDAIAHFPETAPPRAPGAGPPPPGGCRFSALTIAAGATEAYHQFIAGALGELAEPDQPGFHTTPTIDFVYVVAGELVLELDQGSERVLREGDSAVLNGVRHRWHNRGGTDATLLAAQIGAQQIHAGGQANG